MVDWCQGPLFVLCTFHPFGFILTTSQGIALILCVVIAGSIMLGLSFSIVDESEYALRFNMASHSFYDEVDEMGRQFVGLARYHINFPRRYITITFEQGGDVN